MSALQLEWSVPDIIPLDPEKEITFGRGNVSTVMLHSPRLRGHLSRKHASIKFNKATAAWEITDLQSINGVSVNGEKLTPGKWATLALDDHVCFGVNTDENELKYALAQNESKQFFLRRCGQGDEPQLLPPPPAKKPRLSDLRNDPSDLTQEVECALLQPWERALFSTAVPCREAQAVGTKTPASFWPDPLPSLPPSSRVVVLSTAANPHGEGLGGLKEEEKEEAVVALVGTVASETKPQESETVDTKEGKEKEKSEFKEQEVKEEKDWGEKRKEDSEKEELLRKIAALEEQLEKKSVETLQNEVAGEEDKCGYHDDSMITSMEEEFTCCICQELFVRAHTLTCAHSFCEVCIRQWMVTKMECPVCRKPFTSQPVHSLALDNAITKIVDKLGPESKAAREAMVTVRSKSLCPHTPLADEATSSGAAHHMTPAPSRGHRRSRRVHGSEDFPIVIEENENGLDDDDEELDSTESDDDEDEDDYEEGFSGAYYGGYGRCYNCGKRGHWSNGCPERW